LHKRGLASGCVVELLVAAVRVRQHEVVICLIHQWKWSCCVAGDPRDNHLSWNTCTESQATDQHDGPLVL